MYPYLRPPARLAGVDLEPRWGCPKRLKSFGVPSQTSRRKLFSFHQGDVTKLPLPEDSFDVVTCQTVLMHLAQPLDAMREMLRILRSGGLLVCVEPNNLLELSRLHLAHRGRTGENPRAPI